MPSTPLQIALGKVETLTGELEFTLVVSEGGDAHIQVCATDASKHGVVVMLDADGYELLKAIIKNSDDVINRMIRAGRIKRMVLPY